MNEIISLLIALPCAIGANIVLGMVHAKLEYEFDWVIAKRGIIKGVSVYVGVALLYGVGYLLPTFEIVVAGVSVTVIGAIITALYGGIAFYAGKAIGNFREILNVDVKDVFVEYEDDEFGIG